MTVAKYDPNEDDEEIRITAITYTKLRDQIGMVGISIQPTVEQGMVAFVKLARHWEQATQKMPTLPDTVHRMWQRAKWGQTYIEQETGEHLIESLHAGHGVPVTTITTRKLITEPTDITNIKVMDRVEMTEYLSLLLLTHKVVFPPAETSVSITALETQMPFWSRHTTEAGAVDYYAPGEEPDDLVRALMVCCFAGRNYLGWGGSDAKTAQAGSITGNPFNTRTHENDIQYEIESQMRHAFPGSYPHTDDFT